MSTASQSPAAALARNAARLSVLMLPSLAHEQPRPWVALQPFGRELGDDVLRHRHQGFGDETEPAQLHHADDHFAGFAGADRVRQADVGAAMIRSMAASWCACGRKPQLQAGQGEVGAVAAAFDMVVEPLVVERGKPAGPLGVFPDPLAEPLVELAGLVRGGRGSLRVDNPADRASARQTVDAFLCAAAPARVWWAGICVDAPLAGGHHASRRGRCGRTTNAPPAWSTTMLGSSRVSRRNCCTYRGADPAPPRRA